MTKLRDEEVPLCFFLKDSEGTEKMRDAGFVVTWNVCKCKKTKGRNLRIFAEWAEAREKTGVASDCDPESPLCQ
jgi:hypothetical protein